MKNFTHSFFACLPPSLVGNSVLAEGQQGGQIGYPPPGISIAEANSNQGVASIDGVDSAVSDRLL